MARAEHALVSIRHVRAAAARAWPVSLSRDVGVWRRIASGISDDAQVRSTALSAVALYLLSCWSRYPRVRHDDARPGFRLSRRRQSKRDRRSIHVRPRTTRQPGDDLQGAEPSGLSAADGRLV